MTDGSNKAILDVIDNIIQNTNDEESGTITYSAGSIFGISENSEVSIINKLHNEDIIEVIKIQPAFSFTFTDQEDPTIDPILRNHQTTSTTINKPTVVEIKFEKKNLLRGFSVYSPNKQLTKDRDGDFCFNGEIITINGKPLNRDTLNYQILDILYTTCDMHGKVSLQTFEKEYKKRRLTNKTAKELIKSVNNGIQNLFSRAKVKNNSFKNNLKNGKPIVDKYSENNRFAGWIINLS